MLFFFSVCATLWMNEYAWNIAIPFCFSILLSLYFVVWLYSSVCLIFSLSLSLIRRCSTLLDLLSLAFLSLYLGRTIRISDCCYYVCIQLSFISEACCGSIFFMRSVCVCVCLCWFNLYEFQQKKNVKYVLSDRLKSSSSLWG